MNNADAAILSPESGLSWAQRYPALWRVSAWASFVLCGLCVILAYADSRTLFDISVWIKPFKFYLSSGVYFVTLVLLAALMPAQYFATLRGRIMVWLAVLCMWFELGYITLQAALGEASHFNGSTALHANMYSLMGVGAVMLVVVVAWLGLEIARQRGIRSPLLLAVVLGTLLTFALGGGFGGVLGSNGGHWVGECRSDAGGLPFFGWSTRCGDLRASHFFGLHAMQVIPLLGLAAQRWLSRALGFVVVVVGSTAYAGLSVATFVQAMNGQPLLSTL
ncbi:MAG: hypothetical protein AB8B93_20825 [Pseudomonadales bacterium]